MYLKYSCMTIVAIVVAAISLGASGPVRILAAEEASYEATTAKDPSIAVDRLRIRVKPLTKDEGARNRECGNRRQIQESGN